LAPQGSINETISRSVSLYFGEPILDIALVLSLPPLAPSIAMPEFTIAKNGNAMLHQNEVRPPENPILFSIPEASLPQGPAQ
jgi:hypothetical protein